MELVITVIIIIIIKFGSTGPEISPLALTNSTLRNSNFLESAVKKLRGPTAEPGIPLPHSQNPATGPCHAPANTVRILTHYFISNSHLNAHNIRNINLKFFVKQFLPSCQFVHFQPTTHLPRKSVNRSSL